MNLVTAQKIGLAVLAVATVAVLAILALSPAPTLEQLEEARQSIQAQEDMRMDAEIAGLYPPSSGEAADGR